jgi:hypothetical protein
MKKMRNVFLVVMVSFMMLMPAFSGTNATYAKSNVTLAYAGGFDWLAATGLVKGIYEALEGLFCPDTPQNRCKGGVCQSGSCISFRAACGSNGSDCGDQES